MVLNGVVPGQAEKPVNTKGSQRSVIKSLPPLGSAYVERGQYHAVLKGRNFHNRRSSTCGREVSRAHYLKGRTGGAFGSPAFGFADFQFRQKMYDHSLSAGR
jgi:hypothetical protein